ncbi:MAG: dihydrofolate reductase [Lachnospira sp.]|nr:dihydrofolate reductase [Lachnospira sp.]
MKLIAAVDNNWAIGKAGKMLVSIPEDMEFFREETMGKVVIMGRKTFETLKDRSPLIGRVNVIITSNRDYKVEGAIVCYSVEEALKAVAGYDTDDVYVIGGGTIYEQMLDMCDEAHITKIDYEYDADTFFPNLDNNPNWYVAQTSDEKTYFDIVYEFVRFVKKC